MKELIEQAIDWIKQQPINGCITGSCLLDYFEGQDIDVFVYNEQSFNKILFAMKYDKMFQILDPLEQWKFDEYINKGQSSFNKLGLVTIKFKYNLSVDINVIYKKYSANAFSVLASFDMNIICKAYDIASKEVLDLTNNTGKVADWNRWNSAYYDFNIWRVGRLLRQVERCIKYYNRGYDTDKIILKYIDLIREYEEYESVFKSEKFNEKLEENQRNISTVKELMNVWLETHIIQEKELTQLKELTKSF